MTAPQFVTEADGILRLHDHPFRSDRTSWRPAHLLNESRHRASAKKLQEGGLGNCIACHAAPDFSDFSFHNSGATQEEYDACTGRGASLPSAFRRFRPGTPTPTVPPPSARTARGVAIPRGGIGRPAGHDRPRSLEQLQNPLSRSRASASAEQMICASLRTCGARRQHPDLLLDAALGSSETPGLRDLGHSEPTCTRDGRTAWKTSSRSTATSRTRSVRACYETAHVSSPVSHSCPTTSRRSPRSCEPSMRTTGEEVVGPGFRGADLVRPPVR